MNEAPVRKQISKGVRFDVFKRDGFRCQYCGRTPPDALLHVDHINPVALGGGNESDNLITACSDCNLGKAATPLSVAPRTLKDRAEETEEREQQIAGYAEIMQARRDRIEADAWEVAEVLQPGASDGYSTAKLKSIKMFITKIGLHECLEAADLATLRHHDNRAFKYFCGVCWNKVRDLPEPF